ncbi:MAG: hypothetical protein PF572_05780 [Patescibacteria group bacterium]|jgi:hypothetical protein|nr:hypothetical protein [Patescibacteria group bacterium]
MKKEVYNLYKPLRNHLRPVGIENAFYAIWAYLNFFQFNNAIPNNIQVDKIITDSKNDARRFLSEWELSLLAREMIVNGQENLSGATKNFQNYNYFSNAINKIKEFESNLSKLYINKNNILTELRRLSHRQFPWQQKPNSVDFIRYYKIYNNERLKEIAENKLKLSIQQWYTIGTAITGGILSHPKLNIDSEITIAGITKKHFDIFINFTSTNLTDLKEIIQRDVDYDDQYVYAFNPLEYYPLIKIKKYYYCPIITFLIWRMTSGIYFDLVNEKNFGNNFGFAFQDYIEEISKKVFKNKKIAFIPEEKYYVNTKTQKDSVDFIIKKNNLAFFVEAKAKRIQNKSKTQLLSNETMEKDLNILAEDILQIYKTIRDYKNGCYKHFKYDKSIIIYPLLVTLEDWYLFGEDVNNLKEKVKQKLITAKLSLNCLDEMPYTTCSIKNYEHLVQVINNIEINVIMNDWFKPEHNGHNFGQFLFSNYSKHFKSLDYFFPNDFENIYPDQVMKKPPIPEQF